MFVDRRKELAFLNENPFSRAGFTASAFNELKAQNGLAVDLAILDSDLTSRRSLSLSKAGLAK